MAKKFSIHDWQAKQRLTEQDDFQKRQDRLTPGKNPDAFYGDGQLDKLRGLGNGSDQDLLTTLRNQIEQGVLDSKMKDQFVNLLTKLIDRGISKETAEKLGRYDSSHAPIAMGLGYIDKMDDDIQREVYKDNVKYGFDYENINLKNQSYK